MKKKFLNFLINFILTFVMLLYSYCSKKNEDTNNSTNNSMTITSISPTNIQSGKVEEITIIGTNFEPNVSAMMIRIGGINIQPNSATETTLKFYVPGSVSAGTYKIEVIKNNNGTISSVTSQQEITTIAAKTIMITDFNPKTFSLGTPTTITINGTNFNTDNTKMIISIGDVNIQAVSSTETTITVNIVGSILGLKTGTFKLGIKDISTSNDATESSESLIITQ